MTKKKDIEFWTVVPGLSQIPEVLPKKMNQIKPEWWNSMPPLNQEKRDVRHCPSFIDMFSSFYVIPMWTDVKITIKNNKIGVETSSKRFVVQYHHDYQFKDELNKYSDELKGVLKFINPWMIKTPPGYSILQMPYTYDFNEDFYALTGIIDTDQYHVNNPQIYVKSNKQEFFIKRGQPLYSILPFKRDSFNLQTREMTKKDRLESEKSFLIFDTKFSKGYSHNRKHFR